MTVAVDIESTLSNGIDILLNFILFGTIMLNPL